MKKLYPTLTIVFLFGMLPCQFLEAVEWSLTKNPIPQAGVRPDEYGLRGVWANSCIPEIVSVRPANQDAGNHITQVLTRSPQTPCNPRPSPFLLLFRLPENLAASSEFYWFHQDDPAQVARLLGFKLLSSSRDLADIRPASGWWWPEPGSAQDSGPGTGLTVDYQDGLLTLITETFNTDGQPEWLLGTAPMKGGITNTELIKFTHGQTLTGDYRPPLIDNSRNAIHVRFLSASRAQVWLESREGDGLDRTISLRKLMMVRYFMDPPILERLLHGRWLLAPEDRPDYARQAQQFRIVSIAIDELLVSLNFADAGNTGTCRVFPGKLDSPPQQCEIQINTDTGVKKYTFNSFSIDRMRGHDQFGARITAFKINPN